MLTNETSYIVPELKLLYKIIKARILFIITWKSSSLNVSSLTEGKGKQCVISRRVSVTNPSKAP